MGMQAQNSIPGADQVWEKGGHCFKKMMMLFSSEGLRGQHRVGFVSLEAGLAPDNPKLRRGTTAAWSAGGKELFSQYEAWIFFQVLMLAAFTW